MSSAQDRFGELYLMAAQPDHADYWLHVRNDHEAVKWSRIPKPIDPQTHRDWFAESLRMPTKRRLFLLSYRPPGETERPAGIVRADHRGTWTELSIVIDPAVRGRGLGTRAIQIVAARMETLGWPVCGAVVNGHNRRSLRMFLKAGFAVRARRWLELRRTKKTPRTGGSTS